jgi:hypothetical protein
LWITTFRVVTPWKSEKYMGFGNTYHLHPHGRRVSQTRHQQKQAAIALAGVSFGLLFDPEHGGDVFLLNVGLFSELQGITNRKTLLVIVTVVGTSNRM